MGVTDRITTGPPAIETGDAPPTPRITAPGGWRRALTAFLLGAVMGVIAAAVSPRPHGPRRTLDSS